MSGSFPWQSRGPGRSGQPSPERLDDGREALTGVPLPFEPANHTVAEVVERLDAHPDEVDAVLAAESAGKARKGILSYSPSD